MLSDTLQHAGLNAALQPYYSEMCFDTFPLSPRCCEDGGERGGSGLGGRGWMAHDQEPTYLDVVLLSLNYCTFNFPPLVLCVWGL